MAAIGNSEARRRRRKNDRRRHGRLRQLIEAPRLAGIAIAVSIAAPSPALAITSTNRLVYSFTYSANQNVTARDSSQSVESNGEPTNGNSGGLTGANSSISHYNGNQTDKGTIAVEIVRQQTDGGLIVSISEHGEQTRRAPPATCVVYPNTHVICDPNTTVNPEEYTLLRFLGRNFVDPNALDPNRHWSVTQNTSASDVKADYTIGSNSNGIMQIGETRKIRPTSGAGTTDVRANFSYDFARAVPTFVDEYVTQRQDNGVSGTTTTIYQTTLGLLSDTVATPL
jgi:hypothetical protein